MHRTRPLLPWLVLLATSACGGPYVVQARGMRPALADPLPALVMTTQGLVLRSTGSERLRVALPTSRLPLEILRLSDDGTEAIVHLRGGIAVTAVARRDDLGVLVCQPGPLTERVYAGAGNLLTLRSGIQAGAVHVHATVLLPTREPEPGLAWRDQFQRQGVDAQLAVDRLCPAKPMPRHAGTAADPHIGHVQGEVDTEDFPKGTPVIDFPKDVTLTLLDRPGDGAVVYTRPATRWGFEVVRLRHEGDWDLVAVGDGPYLTGWLPARPPRAEEPVGGLGILGALSGSAGNGPWSLHTTALAKLPLHHLPAGTVIQQMGIPFARLDKPGFARVGTLKNGWVYVTAAVDSDVVVEGWLRPEQVGAKVE
jgi:hypothetical protein